MGGTFQTSREIFKNPIWRNITEFRIFFLIYGNAVFKEVRVSDDLILQRGQWLRSTRNIQTDLTYVENRQVKTYSLSVINRTIKRLVDMQRVCTKTHELGTVFTVVNYEQYQGFGGSGSEELGTELGTVEEQSRNNNKKYKKVNTNTSSPKQVYDEKSLPYRTANYLHTNILKFKKDLKQPNMQVWANDMRMLIELDKRDPKEIGQVIEWVTKDTFWQSNILSPKKLREKWDMITAKMKQDGFKQTNKQQPNLAVVPQMTDEQRKEYQDAIAKQRERNGVQAAVNG